MRSTFWSSLPVEVQQAIVPVDKYQQLPGGTTAAQLEKTTGETVWLPSMYEVYGATFADYNESEGLMTVAGYAPFQYRAYQGNNGSDANAKAVKTYNGAGSFWWTRSAGRYANGVFCLVYSNGGRASYGASGVFGVAPCFAL